MARYAAGDVEAFLAKQGYIAVDRYTTGQVWANDSGFLLTLPDPIDGWFDAEVIDRILSDRWIWTGPSGMKRHEADR